MVKLIRTSSQSGKRSMRAGTTMTTHPVQSSNTDSTGSMATNTGPVSWESSASEVSKL